jgi:hypothetical protein
LGQEFLSDCYLHSKVCFLAFVPEFRVRAASAGATIVRIVDHCGFIIKTFGVSLDPNVMALVERLVDVSFLYSDSSDTVACFDAIKRCGNIVERK